MHLLVPATPLLPRLLGALLTLLFYSLKLFLLKKNQVLFCWVSVICIVLTCGVVIGWGFRVNVSESYKSG